MNKKDKLATVRSRLSDISWWMRLLSQCIAQRANKEDGEVGKFFQARYRAVRLLDETAILASAAYVDLNPIRAAIEETIKESAFTSAQKRAAGISSECSVGIIQCSENANRDSAEDEIRSSLLPDQSLSAAASSSIVNIPSAERRVYGTRGDSRPEDRSGYGCRMVKDFGKLFSVVDGQPQRIDNPFIKASQVSSSLPDSSSSSQELMASSSAAGC